MSFLRLATVRGKLSLIAMALALPAFVLMYLLLSSHVDLIAPMKQEQVGQQYLLGFRALAEHLPQRRGVAASYLAGGKADAADKAKLAAKSEEIGKDLAALDELDRRIGPLLANKAEWGAIKTDW